MYYIGIDLGTSGVKLLLVDEKGSILNEITREYPISFPHPGWSEQKPEDWWQACREGIPELLKGFDGNQVAGIGAGVAVYAVLVIALRLLRAEDVKSLPKGEKIAKLLHLK